MDQTEEVGRFSTRSPWKNISQFTLVFLYCMRLNQLWEEDQILERGVEFEVMEFFVLHSPLLFFRIPLQEFLFPLFSTEGWEKNIALESSMTILIS